MLGGWEVGKLGSWEVGKLGGWEARAEAWERRWEVGKVRLSQDRGVGKKVGSWEGEKVRLSQDRGVGKKVRSWEGEIKPGQRRGKEGGKLGR